MLPTLFWLELLVVVLLVWAAFVRLNAHFFTPGLRYPFSVLGWFVLVGVVILMVYRDDVDIELHWTRSYMQSLDVLIGGRTRLTGVMAVLLPVTALAILVRGLRTRVNADGKPVPRARSWRWSILLGGPILLVGFLWGGIELYERSLRRELDALGDEAKQVVAAAESLRPPLPPDQNAAEQYAAALRLLDDSPVLPELESTRGYAGRINWHGRDVQPLSADEERAAELIVAAGKMPACRFQTRLFGADEETILSKLFQPLEVVMLRRAATSADDRRFAESILALRDFYTHTYREPQLRFLNQAVAEINYLWFAASLASRCPERLGGFDADALSHDDQATILGALDDEIALMDAESSQNMSQLFEPNAARYAEEPRSSWTFGAPLREPKPPVFTRWWQREALRIDRIATVAEELSAYRPRIERFRRTVATVKSTGRPDWSWFLESPPDDAELTELSRRYDQVLRNLMSWTSNRYEVLAARRLANTGMAAARFGHKHGRYPETLDELVPEFLHAVPTDPFNGRPISFDVEPDSIVLYVCSDPDGGSYAREMLKDGDEPLDVRNLSAIRIRRP